GTVDSAASLERVLVAASALPQPPLVVVDEAYFEFAGETVTPWRHRFPNLVAVRTLSKAFALPGVRVGFGIGARDVVARLERVRPPGSISTISAQVGAEALRRPEVAHANVRGLALERAWFAARLHDAGWQSMPSVTNFLLVRFGDHASAEEAAERLLRSGIVPRTFGPANPLRGHLRLTVRSRDENERLLQVVRAA
ncbi:MAG TPA: aminotransferase class I/II-fold pyridoxal phosphate-dependent enzyme, partial [Candidatus Caenarcaniphilales bacterium]|nr:aminotransferase class I/II-fold pyridoxal phosphate-dependent enzyme [Candidatus Caenarcaniphilales bacterium]